MKRVLIAEDDMVGRHVMSNFMGGFAHCDLAVDGLEALNLLAGSVEWNTPYDLVFLDIMMPQMDGMTVLRTLRGLEARKRVHAKDQVGVIMITAVNDRKTVMESHELGCIGFVFKPIDLGKLRKLLHETGFFETDNGTGP